MSHLWRYLLFSYGKTLSFSTIAFVVTLIVSRIKEIARFTALTGEYTKALLFSLYQIPLILPLALPISAFLSALLLAQKMSRSKELTALRASGISLSRIVLPLALFALFWTGCGFVVSAELAPYCKRASKQLLYAETSSNPLLLLQRQNLINIKKTYIQMEAQPEGTKAKNFLWIGYNEGTQRFVCVLADTLLLEKEWLVGENVSIISHSPATDWDTLIVENQHLMKTHAPLLSEAMKKKSPKVDIGEIPFRLLPHHPHLSALLEMGRRSFLALSIFTLTLLGFAFGIEEGRFASKKNLLLSLALSFLLFVSYFATKGTKNHPHLSHIIFSLPHTVLWMLSLRRLYLLQKGSLS